MTTPSAPITLRALAAADFDRWLELWKGYQQFYHVSLPDEATQTTFRRFLDDTEPMHCTLAVRGQAVIGMVHYIEHRSCWTPGDYCYLQDLYVDPSARGQGAGRLLIEHVYEHARALGCSRVYWLTQENNTTARALYDQVADNPGFIQYRKAL
ncbi:N-acetyltransferase family protein [Castellaniella sp.]|uniref:GNAT family N-acetyltransferase n=1 Tax=Castellaniella sp. TaxID=1955812 RepID=UPI003562FC19